MNLDIARKVNWLKSKPRPLGELLDEGFLDQSRLEWAAMWAYKPELKQAAQVILESMDSDSAIDVSTHLERVEVDDNESGLEVGISVADARATSWPFRPYKGQAMGTLVDTHQLTLRDLGYAIENAWNDRVRKAAIALSLVRLEQVVKEPIPSAGLVHVISSGRSYSESKESQLTLILGAVLGAPLAWCIYFFMGLISKVFRVLHRIQMLNKNLWILSPDRQAY
ncbi:MAG: hypothetical protein JXB38_21800 [Anaerolineales bacterium]|nr:hypothetical protein [Anaerolineales bacterium]